MTSLRDHRLHVRPHRLPRSIRVKNKAKSYVFVIRADSTQEPLVVPDLFMSSIRSSCFCLSHIRFEVFGLERFEKLARRKQQVPNKILPEPAPRELTVQPRF